MQRLQLMYLWLKKNVVSKSSRCCPEINLLYPLYIRYVEATSSDPPIRFTSRKPLRRYEYMLSGEHHDQGVYVSVLCRWYFLTVSGSQPKLHHRIICPPRWKAELDLLSLESNHVRNRMEWTDSLKILDVPIQFIYWFLQLPTLLHSPFPSIFCRDTYTRLVLWPRQLR